MTGHTAGILAVLGLVFACGRPEPRPIAYGRDLCDHCHMTIADPRFAAELVTRTGRVYTFDDAGCLAAFLRDGISSRSVASIWVNDFTRPDRLLDATTAEFVRSPGLHTPMASGLAAVPSGPAADSLRLALSGELLSWKDVLARVPDRPVSP